MNPVGTVDLVLQGYHLLLPLLPSHTTVLIVVLWVGVMQISFSALRLSHHISFVGRLLLVIHAASAYGVTAKQCIKIMTSS